MLDKAIPLSEFLLAELAQRHPPVTAEGRAAMVNAAKPLLAELAAPVLGTLLRRRLGEMAGLAERDMLALVPAKAAATVSERAPARPTRSTPSLIRCLAQCLLLEPRLARTIRVPKPRGTDPDSVALSALVAFCEQAEPPPTTAGVMQYFSGSSHEQTLVSALTAGENDGLEGELLEIQLVEGVKRYRLNAQKRGEGEGSRDETPVDLSPEEAERARQRQLMRDRLAGSP